jgi:hypothetical protein
MARAKTYTKRYGMLYFTVTEGGWGNPDKWGSTALLENAYGWCAHHIAKSDVVRAEARKAAVFDRHRGTIVRTYTRTQAGIIIKDH